MAIAYLAGTFASNSSEDSSVTSWAYDSGATGSGRVLVVFPVYENNTTADVTAITYNGVALTFQAVYVDDGGGFEETIEAWTLANPPTGSNTLAFTLSQTGRDLGFSAAVYTGVNQSTPVGNTAISAQYTTETSTNADLTYSANSVGVYCSSQNRASSGPFTARAGNTQRGEYAVATGNSGFTACLGDRGPETSAGSYNCGSDATTTSVGGGCVAIELIEADGGGGVTLAANSGTYTYSGTAATITAQRKLTADSGSYAYTGTAATLTYTPVSNIVIYGHFRGSSATTVPAPWTYNVFPASTPTAGVIIADLKDDTDTATGISISNTGTTAGYSAVGTGDPGRITTNNSSWPTAVIETGWIRNEDIFLEFGGLTSGDSYELELAGCTEGSAAYDTDFIVNGVTARYDNSTNTIATAEVVLSGTVSGTTLTVQVSGTTSFANPINGFKLTITPAPAGIYSLSCETGSYSYAGTSVDLLAARLLTADSGTYNYTGTAATLTYTAPGSYSLAADSGSYSYLGTAIALTASRTLSADSGAYAYNGTSADLNYGRTLTADSGVYAYAGTSAILRKTSLLTALTGAYIYGGSTVGFIYSGDVPIIPEASGIFVGGSFGSGIAFTSSFGSGAAVKGKL